MSELSRSIARASELAAQGKLEEAVGLYEEVNAREPDDSGVLFALGKLYFRLARYDRALTCLAAAETLTPGDEQIRFNLGYALAAVGEPERALVYLPEAGSVTPRYALRSGLERVRALVELGRFADADVTLSRLEAQGGAAQLAHERGRLLERQGRVDEAAFFYQAALDERPELSAARYGLARAHLAAGRREQALAHLQTCALSRRQELVSQLHERGGKLAVRPAKLAHDVEQLVHLQQARPELGPSLQRYIGQLREMLRSPVLRGAGPWQLVDLDPERSALLAAMWSAPVHIEPCGVRTEVLGSSVRDEALATRWREADGFAVVDDLLTEEARTDLFRYLLRSTIWDRYSYEDGYVGVSLEDGLACPLVVQVATELRERLSGVLGGAHLTGAWAYKYGVEVRGIRPHADFGAVSVNLWLTPDGANLEPGSGGLVFHPERAPRDWGFYRYNAMPEGVLPLSVDRARHFVPYRCNRAVIFDSSYFHETAPVRFRPGYEHRRINLTFVYGYRNADAPRRAAQTGSGGRASMSA